MRLLVLVLNILVGSSLLGQSTEPLAASLDTKANKNNHQRGQATRLRGKNKNPRSLPVNQKKLQNPGDVWVRIRSGMQIPRPNPALTPPDQALANNSSLSEPSVTRMRLHTRIGLHLGTIHSSDTGISPAPPLSAKDRSERIRALQKIRQAITASAPLYNYTPYGRLKLNSAISSRIRKNVVLTEPSLALKNSSLRGIYAEQTRLRTRIDSLPKLHKLDFKSLSEPLISRASPLAKPAKMEPLVKSEIAPYSSELASQGSADLMQHRTKEAAKFDRVNKHIVWYTQHREQLHQVANRAQPYLYHIVESLSKHKLPYELALLPIVESAYQPTALSPKSAAGLWQFIPSTGHDFDLHQSDQYDARLDVAASTQAAMRYLSFLKQHFNGDWLLALAAYNCGLGTVDNAIKLNLAEGLDTDYWSLRLPEETMEYVPRFLALSSIFANPAAHGLKLAPVRNEPYFVKVKIESKHDIVYLAEKDFKKVAQLANLSYEQFNRLNPGYLNPKLAADGPFTFLMPVANANQLHQRLASIAQFLNEPTAITASHAPLKRRALSTIEDQKTTSSLLTDITLPKAADLVTVSDPFLSLTLTTNQTTPRIATQSVVPPVASNSDPKRVKNNI